MAISNSAGDIFLGIQVAGGDEALKKIRQIYDAAAEGFIEAIERMEAADENAFKGENLDEFAKKLTIVLKLAGQFNALIADIDQKNKGRKLLPDTEKFRDELVKLRDDLLDLISVQEKVAKGAVFDPRGRGSKLRDPDSGLFVSARDAKGTPFAEQSKEDAQLRRDQLIVLKAENDMHKEILKTMQEQTKWADKLREIYHLQTLGLFNVTAEQKRIQEGGIARVAAEELNTKNQQLQLLGMQSQTAAQRELQAAGNARLAAEAKQASIIAAEALGFQEMTADQKKFYDLIVKRGDAEAENTNHSLRQLDILRQTERTLTKLSKEGVTGEGDSDLDKQFTQLSIKARELREELELVDRAAKEVNLEAPATELEQTNQKIRETIKAMRELEQLYPALKKGMSDSVRPEVAQQYSNYADNLKRLRGEVDVVPGRMNLFQRAVAGATGAMARADVVLKRYHLSVRDLGIILGAGLLSGGIAFIVRQLLQFAAAAAKAVFEFAKLADKLESARASVERTFGGFSNILTDFAANTAFQFGLAEVEALSAAKTIGNAFASIGIKGEEAARLTELSIKAASELAGSQIPVGDAVQAVTEAVKGNFDAIRKLEIPIDEWRQRDILLRRGLKLTTGTMTTQEKVLSTLLILYEEMAIRQGEAGEQTRSMVREQARLSAALTDLKTEFGGLFRGSFAKAIRFLADGFHEVGLFITDVDAALKRLFENSRIDSFIKDQDLLVGSIKTAIAILQPWMELLSKLIGYIFPDASDAATDYSQAQDLVAEALRNSHGELVLNIDQLQQAEAAYKRVADAQQKIVDVREESARRQVEIERQNAQSLADAQAGIEDAVRNLEEARFDRLERMREAQEKVKDAQLEAFRDIRSAQERLEDFDLQHTRKVEDLQERIRETHEQTRDAIVDAQIDIETALLRGDEAAFNTAARALAKAKEAQKENGDLEKAQRDLAREQEDFSRERARLERDLAETRQDSAKKINQAVQEQHKAERESLKQIEAAQRAVNKAVQEHEEAILDAQRALDEFEIDRSRNMREAQQALEDANLAVKTLAESLGATVDELKAAVNEAVKLREVLSDPRFQFPEPKWNPGVIRLGPTGVAQHGGSFGAFQPFIAGEHGLPELVIPESPSHVISNKDIREFLRGMMGGGGSGGHNFTIIDNTGHAEAIAQAVLAKSVWGVN